MKKNNKIKIISFIAGCLVLLTYFITTKNSGDSKFDDQGNTAIEKEQENKETENKKDKDDSQKEKIAEKKEIKTSVELSAPREGTKLTGENRVLKGRSISSGGKIYYTVSGLESGVLAEGSIDVLDSEKYVDFSRQVSYDRKPVLEEQGSLLVYIIKNGQKIIIKKIGVTF